MKPGDIITIKKGSIVKTIHPARYEYELKRKQKVKLNHTLLNDVVWAGSGGYWC